jgi:hypothetical protein
MTYSEETKEKIFAMKDLNCSWKAIGTAIGKSANAVKKWYCKNRENRNLPPKTKVSKKITDGRIGLKIKQIVQDTPNASLSEVRSSLGSSLTHNTPCPSRATIHRYLKDNNFKMIKLLKKPLISIKNIQKRYQFAQENLGNLDKLVRATIWSDETTVRKHPKGLEIYFRCHSGTSKEDLPINPQIQMGGFSVMFWGCFSIYGVGPLVALEGSQNQHTYKDLLEEYLIPEIRAAKDYFDMDMTFMQDNAPCHKTKLISEFLALNNVPVLDWPPQSPDLNPIENLWAIIKRKRLKKFGIPGTRDELIDQIFTIWDQIELELCQKLLDSMENRLTETVRLRGRSTKY